jgi:hypothetical protein
LGDVTDDHREGGFFGGRTGSGSFAIYGDDGDRWAVRGDLKGLYEVGGERGFDQRGFIIVHPQLGCEVGENFPDCVLKFAGRLVCGRRWRRRGC